MNYSPYLYLIPLGIIVLFFIYLIIMFYFFKI